VTRAQFEATTTVDSSRVVVALTGECDLSGREELVAVLLAAIDGPRTVIVDVGGVTFIDSSGLHGLVTAHHAALQAGGRVYVVNARDRVAALLNLTGLADLLSPTSDDLGRTA
jgi:anti-anti-sigma factor